MTTTLPTSPSDEIKALGLKVTAPRTRILELFQNSKMRHLTAEDVYRALFEEKNSIGIATVYRVLTQFESAGILLRRSFDPEKAYYELNDGTSHDHLICLDCNAVTEFFDQHIAQCQRVIAQEHGFEILEHSTTIFAHCVRDSCAHKKKLSRK